MKSPRRPSTSPRRTLLPAALLAACLLHAAPRAAAQDAAAELMFTGSVLAGVRREARVVESKPPAGVPREKVARAGRFEAFTVADAHRTPDTFVDRIFFTDLRTKRTYEIRNLPDAHRPYDDLLVRGNVLQFDRWVNPHHGVRYRLDLRRRRLVSARTFVDADFIRAWERNR